MVRVMREGIWVNMERIVRDQYAGWTLCTCNTAERNSEDAVLCAVPPAACAVCLTASIVLTAALPGIHWTSRRDG